jgi:ornithine carbamoyltransferase
VIYEQAENRLYAAKAIFLKLMSPFWSHTRIC